MQEAKIYQKKLVFALDIGTRSVVGIVGTQEGEQLHVMAVEILEHQKRSMLDGQVHDVGAVIETAKAVKENLEKRLGFPLEHVCIAAAGRSLQTVEVQLTKEVDPHKEISNAEISALEVEALMQAQTDFAKQITEKEASKFYCVGHSVTNYFLDGFPIQKLAGHRARSIGIAMISTYLPAVVMDSLRSVMEKIGLQVVSTTLEPIAAIHVAIPKEFRILNLALVDIGAGTSDIAITKDGSVAGYSMLPIAGDEISECIASHFLVDFKTAEKMKLSMSNGAEKISYKDIFGKKKSISAKEVAQVVLPSIEKLAQAICDRILEQNKRPTHAVFLIGGGSRIPGLEVSIAKKLGLAQDRVVVRGRKTIADIHWKSKGFDGPEAITPFGIAVTGMLQIGNNFLNVRCNDEEVQLLNLKKQTVGDVIAKIGFEPMQLIGRSGKSRNFRLNGVKKVVRGEPGKPAEITINHMPASLDSVLSNGDNIRVKEAVHGTDAKVRIKDFIQSVFRGSVRLNGAYRNLDARILLNGHLVSLDEEIGEDHHLEILEIDSVAKLMEENILMLTDAVIRINGRLASVADKIKDGDDIQIVYAVAPVYEEAVMPVDGSPKTKESPVASDLLFSQQAAADNLTTDIPKKQENTHEGETAESIYHFSNSVLSDIHHYMKVIVNGKEFFLEKNKKGYFFVEILGQLNFSPSLEEGTLVMKLNGSRAGFTDQVKHGDEIEIYWEK